MKSTAGGQGDQCKDIAGEKVLRGDVGTLPPSPALALSMTMDWWLGRYFDSHSRNAEAEERGSEMIHFL